MLEQTPPDGGFRTSPRGAAYWVFAVTIGIVGTALVVWLYDRGSLPMAGPFVLLTLLPLLWPLFERGQRKKAERRARKQAGR